MTSSDRCEYFTWYGYEDSALLRIKPRKRPSGFDDYQVLYYGRDRGWESARTYALDALTGQGEDEYSCGEYSFPISIAEAQETAARHGWVLFGENGKPYRLPAPTDSSPKRGEALADRIRSRAPDESVLVTVGDISCTQTSVITPDGRHSLRRTSWIVSNNTKTTERIPPWAIVCAIIFFVFFLLGLLFLLVKERRTQGHVQVSVRGEGLFYATQVPVTNPEQITDIEQRVNCIRCLVTALPDA